MSIMKPFFYQELAPKESSFTPLTINVRIFDLSGPSISLVPFPGSSLPAEVNADALARQGSPLCPLLLQLVSSGNRYIAQADACARWISLNLLNHYGICSTFSSGGDYRFRALYFLHALRILLLTRQVRNLTVGARNLQHQKKLKHLKIHHRFSFMPYDNELDPITE